MLFSHMKNSFQLKKPVGNNLENLPDDVVRTKEAFQDLGYYTRKVENGYIDRELDDAIWSFQSDQDLKRDGKMNPGGETESRISKLMLARTTSGEEGDGEGDGGDNDDGDGGEAPEQEAPPPPPPSKPTPPEAEEEDPEGEDEDDKERCRQLSIQLQNEKLQFSELDRRLTEKLSELNPALEELREAVRELREAQGERVLKTVSSGLDPRVWKGVLGAGVAFAEESQKIKEAKRREKQARQKYEDIKRAIEHLQQEKKKAAQNIQDIESEIAENC